MSKKTKVRKKFRKIKNLPKLVLLRIGANLGGEILNQTMLSKEFNVPITTLNYHITKLKGEGLIDSNLKLTKRGISAFKYLWDNEDKSKLRAHNIQVQFNVVRCPGNFPKCFLNEVHKPMSNKKYRGLKTILGNMTIMFYTPTKISCVLPDVYGDTPQDIVGGIQMIVPEIIKILEEEFSGIKINDYSISKIQTIQVAILDSFYAKKVALGNFTYEGKEIAVDESHGRPEIEVTNPSNAFEGIEILIELERKFKEYANIPEDNSKSLIDFLKDDIPLKININKQSTPPLEEKQTNKGSLEETNDYETTDYNTSTDFKEVNPLEIKEPLEISYL